MISLGLTGSPVAQAAELESGYCAVRADFDDLQAFLHGQLEGILESYGLEDGDIIEVQPAVLEVYDPGIVPSSNSVKLELTIGIEALSGLVSKEITARFQIRETPPETGYTTCEIGQAIAWHRTIIRGPFERCPLQDPPSGCEYVHGIQYYIGGAVSSDLHFLAVGNDPYAEQTAVSPTICTRVFYEDCTQLSRWGLSHSGCANTNYQDKVVVICENKDYAPNQFAVIDPANFPGPLALDILNDFDALGDVSAPGERYTVKQYLESSGMVDQMEWVLNDPSGPSPPNDPNPSVIWVQKHYKAKCYLQQLLNDYLVPLLSQSVEVAGETVQFNDLALLGGGIRISDANRRIDFKIPSLLRAHDAEHGLAPDDPSQPCTYRATNSFSTYDSALTDLLQAWSNLNSDAKDPVTLGLLQGVALENVDFVKLVHHMLQSETEISAVGLRVACDLGNNCENNGGDTDGDGFCDGGPNPDYCPETPTSANCDWDGDGIGDGTTWLLGRPATSTLTARDPHCFGAFYPEFDTYGDKRRLRLMNFACGGCDNCGRFSNPELWVDATQIPHNLPIPQEFAGTDATDVDPGTWQPDWDRDWVGDACDPDVDGDGYRNELDCERMNASMGPDLDADGVCEQVDGAFDRAACESTCWAHFSPTTGIYRLVNPQNPNVPTEYRDVGECVRGCRMGELLDNCAPLLWAGDPWCGPVFEYCLLADVTADEVAQYCTPDNLLYCAMQYANPVPLPNAPEQPDDDDDGIGDKCDTGAFGLQLTPSTTTITANTGPTAKFGCYFHGEDFFVQMRTYGGNAEWTGASPTYGTETKTAFEVGACACGQDPSTSAIDGNLDWLPECWEDTCPRNHGSPMLGEETGSGRKYWNPLSAPLYTATHGLGCSGNQCVVDADRVDNAVSGELVYGREQGLSRDESANQQELVWSWKEARQAWWPAGGTPTTDASPAVYQASSATPSLLTRVRATWPDYQFGPVPISYDYDPQSGVSYSPATAVDEWPGTCFGEVYLGPAFVVDIIPGIVDLLWQVGGGAAWQGGLAQLPGSGLARQQVAANVLGWNDTRTELLLYRHGTDGFGLKAAQRFTGAAVSPLAPLTAAIGAVNGGLWGLDAGRHQAALVYQQPYRGSLIASNGAREEIPARLLIGRLSEGEAVTLTDAEALSGQAAPSLYGGRVVYLPRGQQILVLGRSGTTAGPWRLARLSLPAGRWSAPRPVPIPDAEQLLAVAADPVGHRLLLVTVGAKTAPVEVPGPVLRARWLEPTTLAVTPAAPDAPPDLVRQTTAVRFDPLSRQVLIAGGTRDGSALDDVWRLDLRRQTWSPVATLPAASEQPLLYWDGGRQVLWAGESRPDRGGLDVWAYDATTGSWAETGAEVVPPEPTWPVDDTYLPGRSYAYAYPVDITAALPGTVVLGRLAANTDWLGVDIRYGFGETLSESVVETSTGDDLVAALCPPGQNCELVVRAAGGGPERAVPFTLQADSATVTPVAMLPGPTTSRSLSLRGDILYLVGPLGLRIMRASTLDQLALVAPPGLAGIRSATLCGAFLCVVGPGPFGFKVVDANQPASVSIVAHAFVGGGAQDIAVQGWKAYVARGQQGVRIMDLSNPRLPAAAGDIASSGGKVVSVAASGTLLAVAHQGGLVTLYDVQGAPTMVGSVLAGTKLSMARFVAGQLWLLDKQGQSVSAWRVYDPAAPALVGSFNGDARLYITGRWRGDRLYAVDGLHLRVLQAQ